MLPAKLRGTLCTQKELFPPKENGMTVQERAGKQLEGIDDFIQSVMQDIKVPGLALAVVKDGEVLLARGYGKRNAAGDLAVTPQTLFAIGSSSKAFTAMALAVLVDEGKLDWETPVRHYIPSFKLYDAFASERLTPRDLLIHSSGLPRHDLAWYQSTISRKDLFDRLQFFEPLGMTNANFSVHDSQRTGDFALPYKEVEGEVQPIAFYDRFQAVGPAGSINADVLSMAKWISCFLNRGAYGNEGQRLVSEAQFNQLITPQMVCPPLPTLFERYEETFHWNYGLGWLLTSYRGHVMAQHGGNIDGFSALVGFMPDDNFGVVVLTNLDGNFATEIVLFNVCDRLLGLSEVDWRSRFQKKYAELKEQMKKMNEENEANPVPDAPPSHSLSAYAGNFVHPGYGTFTIKQDGDSLKGIYNDLEYTFKHHHYDVFVVSQERLEASFKASFSMNLDGEIESFSIGLGREPGVKPIVFVRAADKSGT